MKTEFTAYRRQDYKTARTLREGFGSYATWVDDIPEPNEGVWGFVMAAALAVIVLVVWST